MVRLSWPVNITNLENLWEEMEKTLFSKRLAELRRRLTGIPADTAWILRPENRRYLSGFRASDTQFTESSGSLLINKDRSVLVTDSRYTTEAESEAIDFEIKTLNQGLIEPFCELVNDMGIRNLAFEEDYLSWGLHNQLSERLAAFSSPICLIPSNGVLEEMRVVKDKAEIEAMEASADLISSVLDEVIAGLKPGTTEKAIAWQIDGLARDAGAEDLAFPSIVASGPNSALPHAMPTARKIETKEPVIMDVGVKLEGYCSDMTRTVFLGEPVSDFKKIYSVVRKAQLAALDNIRPEIESNHPDAVARQVIDDAGFGKYFIHSLGHGVGLATHERPRLGPQNPIKLETGMVVTVEPGIYIPGKGGVRLEEMVVIEEKGPRILTKNDHFYDF